MADIEDKMRHTAGWLDQDVGGFVSHEVHDDDGHRHHHISQYLTYAHDEVVEKRTREEEKGADYEG